MKSKAWIAIVSTASAILIVGACNCDPTAVGAEGAPCDMVSNPCNDGLVCRDGTCQKPDGSGGAGGSGNAGGGTGAGQGTGGGAGGGGFDPDASCAAVQQTATLTKKPVDIIFVIDNSGSMTAEIIQVQNNINGNFASIIQDAGIDYRVIMVAAYGDEANQEICVSAPLSGAPSCDPPPARPANTASFFHYSLFIASTDSYTKILNSYNAPDPFGFTDGGWSRWLRAEATKTFIEITDDTENTMTADTFDLRLRALQPAMFGTPGDAGTRDYTFHAIIGVPFKADASEPYYPSEPLVPLATRCSSAVNSGTPHQQLAKMTGGLRFPVCSANYDSVFRTVAQGVVAGARVACDFAIPPPPPGFSLSNKIVIEYRPSDGGTLQSFNQIADQTGCTAASFYKDNAAGRVYLCPAACGVVTADQGANLAVFFTCEIGIN